MLDPVPMMSNRVARDLWVAALRSDKYQQTTGALRNEVGYCCLGVLCEVAIEAGVEIDVGTTENGVTVYDGNVEHLPESVCKWAGITSNPVAIVDDESGDDDTMQIEREFVMLNDDDGWDFPAIANIVEAQL